MSREIYRKEDRDRIDRAVEGNNLDELKLIKAELGPDVFRQHITRRDRCNRTPIICATYQLHAEIVSFLLSEGADSHQIPDALEWKVLLMPSVCGIEQYANFMGKVACFARKLLSAKCRELLPAECIPGILKLQFYVHSHLGNVAESSSASDMSERARADTASGAAESAHCASPCEESAPSLSCEGDTTPVEALPNPSAFQPGGAASLYDLGPGTPTLPGAIHGSAPSALV
jgi:hypothetical protein